MTQIDKLIKAHLSINPRMEYNYKAIKTHLLRYVSETEPTKLLILYILLECAKVKRKPKDQRFSATIKNTDLPFDMEVQEYFLFYSFEMDNEKLQARFNLTQTALDEKETMLIETFSAFFIERDIYHLKWPLSSYLKHLLSCKWSLASVSLA